MPSPAQPSPAKPKLSSTSSALLDKSRAAVASSSKLAPSPASASTSKSGAAVRFEDDDSSIGQRRSLVTQLNDDGDDDEEEDVDGMDEDAAMTAADDDDDDDDGDDAIMIDTSSLPTSRPVQPTSHHTQRTDTTDPLSFAPLSSKAQSSSTPLPTQKRSIAVPPHRMTPLKRDWVKLYSPLVEECGLQVRMNQGRRKIELKTSKYTNQSQLAASSNAMGGSSNVLQRSADFLQAYMLGFEPGDALVLLRMEECYIESFEIKDVKTLTGDHLSRAIGRIAGKDGKTKYTIENASRTRIVLADTKIHILGTFSSIKIARDAVCNLILGSPPGKVYAGLKVVARRARQRM